MYVRQNENTTFVISIVDEIKAPYYLEDKEKIVVGVKNSLTQCEYDLYKELTNANYDEEEDGYILNLTSQDVAQFRVGAKYWFEYGLVDDKKQFYALTSPEVFIVVPSVINDPAVEPPHPPTPYPPPPPSPRPPHPPTPYPPPPPPPPPPRPPIATDYEVEELLKEIFGTERPPEDNSGDNTEEPGDNTGDNTEEPGDNTGAGGGSSMVEEDEEIDDDYGDGPEVGGGTMVEEDGEF